MWLQPEHNHRGKMGDEMGVAYLLWCVMILEWVGSQMARLVGTVVEHVSTGYRHDSHECPWIDVSNPDGPVLRGIT